MGFFESIQHYVATTPPEIMAAHALFTFGWFPVMGVVIWGLLEVWLDRKQGQYWEHMKWTLLAINVPQDAVQTPKGMENFFNMLAGSKSSITWKEKWFLGKFQPYFSLEIVSIGGRITFYVRCVDKLRDLVEAAFYAQYPEAQIMEAEDNYFDFIPNEFPDEEYDVWGSEMKLGKKSYLPIRTYDLFEHQGEKDLRFKDPLLSILENLGKMRPGEAYMMQILIMPPDEQDWVKEGRTYIEKIYGIEKPKKKSWMQDTVGWLPEELIRQTTGAELFGAAGAEKKPDDFKMFKLTPEERDQLDAVKEKISKIGFISKIRFVYCAKKELFRKGTIASMSKGMFHQYGHQNWNKLGLHDPATPKDDYPWMEWQMAGKQRSLVSRYKNRTFAGANPFYLNVAELATLFHFPAADARTPVLTTLGARRSEAPLELQFAVEGASILANMNRTASESSTLPSSAGPSASTAQETLSVPHIASPTAAVSGAAAQYQAAQAKGADHAFDGLANTPHSLPMNAAERMPIAGMPAPLPPGLDLADQSLPPSDVPENLPLEKF